MISFRSTVRRSLALALGCTLFWPLAASGVPIVIEDYIASDGNRNDYFNGKLLTAHDLDTEQSYERGVKRYLGPTDLTLDELFQPAGRAWVFLMFDDGDAVGDNRSDPADAGDPHGEDLIFLDTDEGTWKGRLYLAGVDDIEDGLYDNLAGTFDRLVSIPEPASAALLVLGLAALLSAGAKGGTGAVALRSRYMGFFTKMHQRRA